MDSRSFFDRLAAKREQDHKRFHLYYEDRRRWLDRIIPHDASVIEGGCGVGLTLAALSCQKKVGFDFSQQMIARAKERDATGTYFTDDLLNITHDEKYEYVLLLDTVNYVADVQACLEQIHTKLCHERSRLIITYYNFFWFPIFAVGQWLGIKTRFPEQNWIRKNDIVNLLNLADFEVIQHGQRVLLPMGIPLLSKLCNAYLVHFPLFRSFALVKYIIARPLSVPRDVPNYSVTVLSAMRNEKGNVRKIVETMPIMGTRTELVFIEGHSTDGTWEELETVQREYRGPLTIRILKQQGTGKANALHEGMEASTGDIVLIYDGDFTVHPAELQKLYAALAAGKAEFVNASRLVYPMQKGAMRLLNLMGNKLFSMLFTWLFSQELADVLSPVKGMFRRNYAAVSTRFDPFGDFDFFLGAGRSQLKMCEIPVHYLERSYGTTKIRRFRHAWLLLNMCRKGAGELKWY